MSSRYEGREVVAVGPGQCPYCRKAVTRVLVKNQFGRTWYTADHFGEGYTGHQCSGPTDDPPLPRAA